MFSSPTRPEIDHHTIKLIVGLIALLLPFLTSLFAQSPISSVSDAYCAGGWSQSIFVGFLFAIAAFLLAYNGKSTREMLFSKAAAGAALGVAMFPCKCGDLPEIIPYVHYISAAIMFLALAYFCYRFFARARDKAHFEAELRAGIYAVCGVTIMVAILALALNYLTGLFSKSSRFTFYGEAVALVAFGFSWLTASRALPWITSKEERLSPFD